MNTDLPNVDELNAIQAEWMALDPSAPKPEIDRVCKLMDKYPTVYVSGHDGQGVCIMSGSPMHPGNWPFDHALKLCKDFHGRTDVAWNGKLGKWYAL